MGKAEQKKKAAAWFSELQGKICKALETLENEAPDKLYPGNAGVFSRKPWKRRDFTGASISGSPEMDAPVKSLRFHGLREKTPALPG